MAQTRLVVVLLLLTISVLPQSVHADDAGSVLDRIMQTTNNLSKLVGEYAIAFVRDGNVWLCKADGSSQEKITSTGGVTRVEWLPDGKKLAFLVQGHSGSKDLYTCSPIGSGLDKLGTLSSPGALAVAGNKNGSLFYCCDGSLTTADFETSKKTTYNLDIGDMWFSVSKDKTLLCAFSLGSHTGGFSVTKMLTGKKILDGNCTGDAVISPDGKKVAFIYNNQAHYLKLIYVISRKSYTLAKVDPAYDVSSICWSPTSSAFAWRVGKDVEIVQPGGKSKRRKVFNQKTNYSYPLSWSSDGRYLLCHVTTNSPWESRRDAIHQIWKVDTHSGAARMIADNATQAAWDPISK